MQLRDDYRNRLVEYEHAASGLLVTYRYDAFGRRTAKSVATNPPLPVGEGWGEGRSEDTRLKDGQGEGRGFGKGAPPSLRGSVASSFWSPQETRYFYGGQSMWQVIEEQDAAGVTQATYAYEPYIDEVVTMRRCSPDSVPPSLRG